jgi:hypothetical protein
MAKPKTPSLSQARYLAWLFAEQKKVEFDNIPPTPMRAVREGWLVECGKIDGLIQFQLSPAGLGALERYLWSVRRALDAMPLPPHKCDGAAQ